MAYSGGHGSWVRVTVETCDQLSVKLARAATAFLCFYMTQSPSHPSSHNSDSSNTNQDTPNTGMYMGYTPAPPAACTVSLPHTRPSHLRLVWMLELCITHPKRDNMAIALLQWPTAGLVTGSASPSLPQAPSLSVGEKRVVEDLQDRNVKRIKMGSGKIEDDLLFPLGQEPMLDQYGRHNGRYVCYKDSVKLVRPGCHKRHLKTEKHLGYKLNGIHMPWLSGNICIPTLK
ncbi:uncharacterized protein F5147DRAFT_656630 [Suillus discolor]|uniref:Uncharacterized protein n=1 Tax=Suillus discolor TaxID=1912936 RepID=A0A9P7JPA7_9AGAM|nr:uncharacterized protein F5147DRAFT_656630 [Suillus discolor]KAG2096315.1 hypothetical protein F5147DRAFT_656630 [Suillus discolor]